MVCSTAILSSSLALSLLRHSAPPTESFVLSPFSFNSALSIVHDGANGATQKELTDLLLNGCTPDDVTNFYSSLALSLPAGNDTGVSFNSANRFYVDGFISLKNDYEKRIEDKYKAKVESINLRNKPDAAEKMNKFVNEATNGQIKDVIKAEAISDDAVSVFINALNFIGKWKNPFEASRTYPCVIHKFPVKEGEDMRVIDMMPNYGSYAVLFRANMRNDVGTLLLLPYQDEQYNFFFLMPNKSSNLETMRNELTGEKFITILNNSTYQRIRIIVPKFKVQSELDGVRVLKELGVNSLFDAAGADLSKISSTPLSVSQISHNAMIEVNEEGTMAAAVTQQYGVNKMAIPKIFIDSPFIYGILRNEDILFIGQYV